MSDEQLGVPPRVGRVLMSEEAIYGLILISGLIVASGSAAGTSLTTFVTVFVTVVVFFCAHVFAGTLGRLAATEGHAGLRASLRAATRHSSGMLAASAPAMLILLLGATRAIADSTALWAALIGNTLLLGALGWVAVARWNRRWMPRILGAVGTAAFGLVLIVLKAVVNH